MIFVIVLSGLLAACSSGPRKPSPRALKQIDRALSTAPGKAQPSIIVKTELALNRVAREEGQLDAYRHFGRVGAQIHTEKGILDIVEALAGQTSPDEPSVLSTKSVFMSCDGSLAVSVGRGSDPGGKVGTYIIVWERQLNIRPDGDEETGYRYVYFSAAADDPQPAPKAPQPAPQPGDIVVEALDAVRADIARCAPRGDIYLEALAEMASGHSSGSAHSRDRTLQWNWFAAPDGKRRITVSLWRKGTRETVLTQDLPSSTK